MNVKVYVKCQSQIKVNNNTVFANKQSNHAMVYVCTKAKRSVAPVPTIAEKVTLTRGSLRSVTENVRVQRHVQ